MNELVPVGPVSPLRQRLIDDMTMRAVVSPLDRLALAAPGREPPGS